MNVKEVYLDEQQSNALLLFHNKALSKTFTLCSSLVEWAANLHCWDLIQEHISSASTLPPQTIKEMHLHTHTQSFLLCILSCFLN